MARLLASAAWCLAVGLPWKFRRMRATKWRYVTVTLPLFVALICTSLGRGTHTQPVEPTSSRRVRQPPIACVVFNRLNEKNDQNVKRPGIKVVDRGTVTPLSLLALSVV